MQRVERIVRRPHRVEERDESDEHDDAEHAETEHDPVGVQARIGIGAGAIPNGNNGRARPLRPPRERAANRDAMGVGRCRDAIATR